MIAALGPLAEIPLGPVTGPLVTRHGDEVAQAYLDAVIAASPGLLRAVRRYPRHPTRPGHPGRAAIRPPRDLSVVYTPMHGVAGALMLRAIERAGFPAPHVVPAQAEPDPDFPTVSFPNPEEPGALDLALAEARRLDAGLVLASDPDGDRLAVAVPDPSAEGGWRALTGDQVGALLGAFILDATAAGPDPAHRLVVSTIVSSTLLSRIAAAAGVRYAETLTGFKWIVRAGEHLDGFRFAYGYEEALGYAVGGVVRDKDGIGAALALLSLARAARAAGQSLLDRWDALEAAHGVHLRASLTVPTRSPGQIMAGLRARPAGGARRPAGGGDGRPGGRRRPAAVGRADLPAGRRAGRDPAERHRAEAQGLPGSDRAGGPGGLAAARRAAAARLAPLRAAVNDLLLGSGAAGRAVTGQV